MRAHLGKLDSLATIATDGADRRDGQTRCRQPLRVGFESGRICVGDQVQPRRVWVRSSLPSTLTHRLDIQLESRRRHHRSDRPRNHRFEHYETSPVSQKGTTVWISEKLCTDVGEHC